MTDNSAIGRRASAAQPVTDGSRLAAVPRGLVIAALSVPELLVAIVVIVVVGLVFLGVGIFLLPASAAALAVLAEGARYRARRWSGVRIPSPYRASQPRAGGVTGWWLSTRAILSDGARWRDLLWCVLDTMVGSTLGLLPSAAIAYGLFGVIMPAVYRPIIEHGGNNWYTAVHVTSSGTAFACVPIGIVIASLGILLARPLLAAHAKWTRWLLAPTATTALAQRVTELRRSRTDAIDSQAAEIRRIERDLHDGAQAKLVAMGMKLSTVEALLGSDPDTARTLVGQTKADSIQALVDLRGLVRGIHPPVLADRGLTDAVRALGIDSGLSVAVTTQTLPRLDPPIESAAYFAITELLTNIGKHAGIGTVAIKMAKTGDTLVATVHDDGVGGAHITDGGGLAGIRRRLAAFDGTLELTSPVGGPTDARIEMPCA